MIKTDQLLHVGKLRAPDHESRALKSDTILAVHDDIAFLFALAHQVVDSQVNLIPATSIKGAERLLAELDIQPDLLIFNCKIRGVCAFASELVKRWPALKVVAMVSEAHRCVKCRCLLVATIEDTPLPKIDRWAALLRMLTHQGHSATQ